MERAVPALALLRLIVDVVSVTAKTKAECLEIIIELITLKLNLVLVIHTYMAANYTGGRRSHSILN